MDQFDARTRNREWEPNLLVPSKVSPTSERHKGELGSDARQTSEELASVRFHSDRELTSQSRVEANARSVH
jgi:hypothetical protein